MSTIRDVLETKGHIVHHIAADATLQEAVVEMCRFHVGALVIAAPRHPPFGILSERDVLTRALLQHKDPATTKVGDVMTREVICIDPEWTVARAMALMTTARCRHLPVVDDDDLVGIISIGDLVRDRGAEQAHELSLVREYVEGRYPG
jgi:signal-transduction protein with cAMP-binding, CBS, and nucleotidyltransferase domain